MRRKILVIVVMSLFGVIFIPQLTSAFPVSPPLRDCLVKKYGSKVALAITKAKVLNTNQKKQVTACSTTSGGSTSGGSTSGGSTSGGSTSSTTGLTAMTYGLLWSVGSNQAGLGNVSDPALLQLADGSLRMFFKNGNEPQIPLSGFDNKIHSYVSADNGKS